MDRSSFREWSSRIDALARGFTMSQVLFAANDAEVFSLLEKPRTAEEVAAERGLHPRGARMLLDGLVAMDLLAKRDGRYQNLPVASACLRPGQPGYQGHIIRHLQHVSARWARLAEAVRTGTAPGVEETRPGPEQLRAFILGMSDIARWSAQEVLEAVDLSGRRHLLDLGAGPATYAITFLRAHPRMRATVFDRPEVIAIAREEVARADLDDRVSFIGGDMTADAYGTGYDLVLLSNIIHAFGPSVNRAVLRRCREALEPGGLLIIKDFLVEDDRSGPPFGLMFALNMLVGTEAGDTYSRAQIEEWTREAGFVDGRALDLTPQSRLWIVRKP